MKDEIHVDMEKVMKALRKNNYTVNYFATKEEASTYITNLYNNETIGFGDSKTIVQMNLYELLSKNNTVIDPNQSNNNDEFLEIGKKCCST